MISPPLSLFFSNPDALPEDTPMTLARLLGSGLLRVFDGAYPPVSYDEASEGPRAEQQPEANKDDADESSSWRPMMVLCSCWGTKLAYCSLWLGLLLLCS